MNRSLDLARLALTLLCATAMGQTTPYQSDAAAAAGARMEAMCPDAMREGEELQARRKPTPVLAEPTRPALRENLLRMAKLDQDARSFLLASGWQLDPESPKAHWMQTVDAANLKRLKHIVNQDGFPSAAMVGLDGVDAAWLLAIHANDGDFQQKVLMLTAGHVRRGEVSADDVAMLTDDWLVARGKPQRYGTNVDIRDGKVTFGPIEDAANVERRRRAAGPRHPRELRVPDAGDVRDAGRGRSEAVARTALFQGIGRAIDTVIVESLLTMAWRSTRA